MPPTAAALEINNLSKTYRDGTVALRGIELDVEEGEFFGLLGPNGAGKSTTIGIITSLVNKTGGTIRCFGVDLDRDPARAKRQIGLVPQEFNHVPIAAWFWIVWIAWSSRFRCAIFAWSLEPKRIYWKLAAKLRCRVW